MGAAEKPVSAVCRSRCRVQIQADSEFDAEAGIPVSAIRQSRLSDFADNTLHGVRRGRHGSGQLTVRQCGPDPGREIAEPVLSGFRGGRHSSSAISLPWR